jgi:hypothetical protein
MRRDYFLQAKLTRDGRAHAPSVRPSPLFGQWHRIRVGAVTLFTFCSVDCRGQASGATMPDPKT